MYIIYFEERDRRFVYLLAHFKAFKIYIILKIYHIYITHKDYMYIKLEFLYYV